MRRIWTTMSTGPIGWMARLLFLCRMRLVPIPIDTLPELGPAMHTAFTEVLCQGNHAFYTQVGFAPPWIAYIAVEGEHAVGGCAFKGAPSNHRVEIAYATQPGQEGRGVATRMALELVRIARIADPLVRIIAQTLPEHNASTKVLRKCGFTQVREAVDEEVGTVWEWELLD